MSGATKKSINYRKHGLTFSDVTSLFESQIPFLVDYDDRSAEDRWIGIGLLKDLVVVVVFTEPDVDTIRLISARKANQYEKQRYFNTFRK